MTNGLSLVPKRVLSPSDFIVVRSYIKYPSVHHISLSLLHLLHTKMNVGRSPNQNREHNKEITK